MNNPNKFNIVIIEDNLKDYLFMHGALKELYNIAPAEEEEWEDLRTEIASVYGEGNRIAETTASATSIRDSLSRYQADLYVIDYLLMEDNDSCNGIRFTEDYISNSKVLIITKSPEDPDNEMKNDIIEFCDASCNDNSIGYMFKEQLNNSFRTKFLKKVKKILPPDKPDEQGSDKTIDLDNIK